jgi:DNA-directed RNA polymerase specialized sigma24 family protein
MINAMCNEYDGELDSTTRSKIRGQCIEYARKATNAHKDRIVFTDRQVEAINAGAISPTTLSQLLDNADKKEYTKAFLPKSSRIPDNKREMIKQLYSQANWSYEEIAEKVGISAGSVANIVNE